MMMTALYALAVVLAVVLAPPMLVGLVPFSMISLLLLLTKKQNKLEIILEGPSAMGFFTNTLM